MLSPSFHRSRTGFTLIELSVVLVIVGLIVGGVLAGQSLVHAAELRGVSREYNQYQTALHAFQTKYLALPGDMPNAVSYWGAQAGGLADGKDTTCSLVNTAATGIATCNGNGNGVIGAWNGPVNEMYEFFRFWQHLTDAGLIAGNYGGISVPYGAWASHRIGTNCPASKLSPAGWSIVHVPVGAEPGIFYTSRYDHILHLGAVNAGYGLTADPAIKPVDALDLDTKMDDGLPDQGKIMAFHTGNIWTPNCVAASDTAYNSTNNTQACALIFKTGY